MAIYRFEAVVLSRRAGQSAVAAAAYRAGERLKDEQTGQWRDYSRRPGIEAAFILAPEGAPAWTQDRGELWNRAEAAEKRKDAQLAREFKIALPHELDAAQREALVRDFAQRAFVDRGMVADAALHAPDREGDARNHHAHVMVTLRRLAGDGFSAKKERDWNRPELLQSWRLEWEQTANRHLERAGCEARIDHRSLEARGIDREPEPKLGPLATQMEREGRASLAGDDLIAVWRRNRARGRDQRQIDKAEGIWSREEEDVAREKAFFEAIQPKVERLAAAQEAAAKRDRIRASRRRQEEHKILAERQRRAARYYNRPGFAATSGDATRLLTRDAWLRRRAIGAREDHSQGDERIGIAAEARAAAAATTKRDGHEGNQGRPGSARERTEQELAQIMRELREERGREGHRAAAPEAGRTRER